MPGSDNPRRLVVEGIDDLYAVVGVMRAHISWPVDREQAPVWIDRGGSVSEILKPAFLDVHLKSRTIGTLGVMIDANSSGVTRYRQLRTLCKNTFPEMPERLPAEGLVVGNEHGRRLGVWIMPDNASDGALEDFLIRIISDAGQTMLEHATDTVAKARDAGAPVREAHLQKARLYSWMALQDPPSRHPREALYSRALDPAHPYAIPFVEWFKRLYVP